MRFSFWLPVDEAWPEMLARARRLVGEGWQGLWVADNLLPTRPSGGELLEAWSCLAALAASIPEVGLGTLVSSNTYRHPALLAKIASTVDRIAGGGRVTLGLGAGWRPRDHHATGILLPAKDARVAMLSEACAILRELLGGGTVSRDGAHYRPRELALNPAPTGRIRLLLGGRSAELAARFADAWHLWDAPDGIRRRREHLARQCARVGRDPDGISILASPLLMLDTDPALSARLRREPAGNRVLVGSAAQIVERVGAYARAGVDEIALPSLGVGAAEMDALRAFAETVFPAFPDGARRAPGGRAF